MILAKPQVGDRRRFRETYVRKEGPVDDAEKGTVSGELARGSCDATGQRGELLSVGEGGA